MKLWESISPVLTGGGFHLRTLFSALAVFQRLTRYVPSAQGAAPSSESVCPLQRWRQSKEVSPKHTLNQLQERDVVCLSEPGQRKWCYLYVASQIVLVFLSCLARF